MRPITQSDIERIYAAPDARPVELSGDLIEHHIRRGRVLRSQVAARFFRRAGVALWRFVTLSPRQAPEDRSSGRLTPSKA